MDSCHMCVPAKLTINVDPQIFIGGDLSNIMTMNDNVTVVSTDLGSNTEAEVYFHYKSLIFFSIFYERWFSHKNTMLFMAIEEKSNNLLHQPSLFYNLKKSTLSQVKAV